MVQALNSVASALIEALRVPDLISMGILMKKLSFSLFLTRCQSLGFAWLCPHLVLANKTLIHLFVCNIDVWSGKKLLTFRILCCSKFECPKVAIKRETRAESECFADEHEWWFYSEAGFTGKVLTSPPPTWEKWNLLALPNFFCVALPNLTFNFEKRAILKTFCHNICALA